MEVYLCRYRGGRVELDGPVDYRWIDLDEISSYPFPKANHKFFPVLRETIEGFRNGDSWMTPSNSVRKPS